MSAAGTPTGRLVPPVWDAVVLAGGQARRLGSVDKPALRVGGRSLLDIALDAVARARETVVVGPARDVGRQVGWAREDPPGGGPLAALAAGLRYLPPGSDTVVVLAADLPAVDDVTIHTLVRHLDRDGVVAVDGSGRTQPLLAAYRRAAIERVVAAVGNTRGRPMRTVLDALQLATLDVGDAAEDIDTPGDLARWQEGHS